IYNRNRPIPPEELIELLWSHEESSTNPGNALKTMFHRLRNMLDELGEQGGRELILRREGTYAWNTGISLELDIDRFDELCQKGASARDEEERLNVYLQALALYKGDFLDKMSSEPWVVPIATYFHNLYVQTVLSTLPMLECRERWGDAAELCKAALPHEPYMEELYSHLMTAYLRQGLSQSAVKVYEAMSELLLSNFGVMPSDEIRALYREATRTVNTKEVSSDFILEQLREDTSIAGALVCDYDIFKIIYHSVARSIARNGDAVHLALISAQTSAGEMLPKRSLDRVVENLREIIRTSLRRGDVMARCSVSQFVLLLPHANYENSRMICERISRNFSRMYPHSPAVLRSSI
ncbi:MAG: diguanylate cyclase, partial [Oscillospiraceae bacterium]|nr:diguanylate cyclase [Oscillospiraceae bacterium]